jgi:hypothetical protein
MANNFTIAKVEKHKVKSGESLASLAKGAGISWKDLALFNWGTDVPTEINLRLRDYVGCTKKTKDGHNYIFSDSDHPGILLIPSQWSLRGLAANKTHTIRVLLMRPCILLLLDNAQGLRIPEAEYEIEFSDKSKQKGRLGGQGTDVIYNPPPGPYHVVYLDYDDILSKSLAASVRKSFDDRDTREVFRLLKRSPEIVRLTIQHYNRYFNDHHGKGLIEDIYREFTDPEALQAVEILMALDGLPIRGKLQSPTWKEVPHG